MGSGDQIGALFVAIGADLSGLASGIGPGGKADKELESFTGRVNAGLMGIAKVGAALAATGIVAVAVGLGIAAKSASDFQQQMRMIVTQAGASNDEMNAMSKGLLDMAGSVGTGPEELAKGLYHLESAGFRGATALSALRIAAEGAKIGNANLEDVTNALDAVLVAGGPDAKNMAASMGELNAIVGAGDMRMQDLADAMGTGILATAHEFGLSLKDVGAALAVMGDNNIRGSDAATKLRMSISLLAAPSTKAAAELKKIGLNSIDLGKTIRDKGLVAGLEDLQAHLGKAFNMSTSKGQTEAADLLSRAFGGGKSAGTILLLLQQLDRLKTKEGDITVGAKGFDAAWANTQKNFTYQWSAATAAIEAAGIKIGTKLLPPLTELFQNVIVPLIPKLADMASIWMDKAVPAVEQFANWIITLKPDFVIAFGIISSLQPYLIDIGVAWAAWNVALAVTKAYSVASLVLGVANGLIYLVRTQGLATTAQWLLNIALDANPIGVVIIAVAALAAGFIWAYKNVGWFRDIVNGLGDALKAFAQQFWTDIKPIFDAIGGAISGIQSFTGQSHSSAPGRVGNRGLRSFDMGGIVPGAMGAPMLAVVHGGERVLTPAQQASGGGGYSPEVANLLSAILNELRTPPGGQTGVEAALYKATHLANMNRARGMAGA